MAGGDKVVYYAPKDVRIERMDITPELENGEVLVEVEACAICGTDIKSYEKGNPRIVPPMTMGHEFVGRIVDCGRGVATFAPGKGARVVMATTIGCGRCRYCVSGHSNLCYSAEAMGFHYPGGMAPWVKIPERAVRLGHLVEVDDIEPTLAAIAEPLSCVVNGLSRVPMGIDVKDVLVIGLGPLGLLHALVARANGATRVVCVEFPGRRADLAQKLGFFEVLAPDEIGDAYKDLTEGEGFDLVVVAAPHGPTQAVAPVYARKGGYVSFFASLPQGEEILQINSRTIHYGELTIFGTSDSTPAHLREAVKLLKAYGADFSQLITHCLPMCGFHEGLSEIAKGNAVKVVLVP